MRKEIIVAIFLAVLLATILISVESANAAATVSLYQSGASETTISLSWSKSTDLLFSKYELYMSSYGTNGPYDKVWSTTDKSVTSTFMNYLSPSTNYWFYIKDIDVIGSAQSSTYQASTTANPQLNLISRTQTTVSLQWSDYNYYSDQVPFTNYVIQMSTNGNPPSTVMTISDSSQNTYTVTGLSPATYDFTVTDKVGGQYTSMSNAVNVVIHQQVSVQISGVATSCNVGQQIQFAASASGGTNSYTYQWFANGDPIGGETSSNYIFSPNEAVTYTIYASAKDTQDSWLDTATSNTLSVSAIATPPPSNQESNNPQTSSSDNSNNGNNGSNQGIPISIMIVGIVIVIVVVAAIIGVVVWQKQKSVKKP